MINQSIFKAYDIRGLYPQELDADAAYRITRGTARFLKTKDALVAMDNRHSSPALKDAVARGLKDEGIRVIDAGVTTTPMFYFAVNESRAGGGIMITASHNPPQYNGLKIVSARARPVGENSGMEEIKDMAFAKDTQEKKSGGTYTQQDYLARYVSFLTKGVLFPKVRILADAACGTVGNVLRALAAKTEVKLIPLCFAPCETPTHEGNPLKDENVQDLVRTLRAQTVDFGVAFDTDADRVFFFSSDGKRIPSHAIASLLARDYLAKERRGVMIGDVRMPKVFSETVTQHGGKYIESRVGHVFMKQALAKHKAIFGAEVSGHYYFRDFFGADSGLFTLTRILDIMAREHKSLEELTGQYMTRFQSGEINHSVADKKGIIAKLREKFSSGTQSERDGLSIRYHDWWCNIRPSNTEPLLRLNIEADTKGLLDEMQEKIEGVICANANSEKMKKS